MDIGRQYGTFNSRDECKISVINVSPCNRIIWNNLTFVVEEKKLIRESTFKFSIGKETKQILQPQSGYIESGNMTALMGPSGAGKTTLLSAITGKCNLKFVSGDIDFISIGGKECINNVLRLSYVPQKDFLYQDLTIRETLTFAFECSLIAKRQARNRSKIRRRIEILAKDINLSQHLDTKIANCSGGQVKRISVASELISNPNVLILDEPTTGLDSYSASLLISTLKKLINRNSNFGIEMNFAPPAVICAIHQPSTDVFNLFDQIYALAEGGKNIFFGPPSNVSRFLSLNDIILPSIGNPADFLLVVCQMKCKINMIEHPTLKAEKAGKFDLDIAKREFEKLFRKANIFSMIFNLMFRYSLLMYYNPWPILIRSLSCILSTALLNAMYTHDIGSHDGCFDTLLGIDRFQSNESFGSSKLGNMYQDSLLNQTDVLDNVGLVFVTTLFIALVHGLMSVVEIPSEVRIITNEIGNHWYSMNAIIFSRYIFMLLTITIHIAIYSLFALLVTDQIMDFERYILITSLWIFLAVISELTGSTIGILLRSDIPSAVLLQIGTLFPLLFGSGFFIRSQYIHSFWKPLAYISHLKHVFEGIMITIYGNERCGYSNGKNISFHKLFNMSASEVLHLISQPYINNNIYNTTVYNFSSVDKHGDAVSENITKHIDSKSDVSKSDTFIFDYFEYFENRDTGIEYVTEYDDLITTKTMQQSESFILSMFGLVEENIEQCYIYLCILTILYILINFSVMKIVLSK